MTWSLAIDYGTSFTAAAIIDQDGTIEVLEIEDSHRFPSSVLWGDDELVVGKTALNQARRYPERFERAPKRLIGQPASLLGGRSVPVENLVAAVLTKVAQAARTRQGQSEPSRVIITHPAGWQEERLSVLRNAASKASFGEVELLSEPEAAAWFFVSDRRGKEPELQPGQSVAIYDLGGGTFDTAVLRRDEQGFNLAGPPGGEDWFGGEEFDQRLFDHVMAMVRGRDIDLAARIEDPPDPTWQRTRQQLSQDIRELKEALSNSPREAVAIATPDEVVDVEVTREEFEKLIRRDLERSIGQLESTIRRAGLDTEDVAAVYLTGGSSRIPLAAALVAQFHDKTYTRPDPKTLVTRGAVSKAAEAAPTTEVEVAGVEEPARKQGEEPTTVVSNDVEAGRRSESERHRRSVSLEQKSAKSQTLPTLSSPAQVAIPGSRDGAKIRNPIAVWALSLVTLGIYSCFWWYYINRELRDLGQAKEVDELGEKPELSTAAWVIGGGTAMFLAGLIPFIWTIVGTSQRIQRAQSLVDVARLSGWTAGLLWIFTLGIGGIIYTQSSLNKVWQSNSLASPPAVT